MPRTARSIEATVYHVLKRGNGRMRLLHEDGDYEAFEPVLTEGLNRYRVDRREARAPIHPPWSRRDAEDAKQSVMSPFLSHVEAMLPHEIGTHLVCHYNGDEQRLRLLRCGLPR